MPSASRLTTFAKFFTGTGCLFSILFVVAYAINVYKLLNCDFKPSYKEEAIHAVGLIPPLCVVTVWADNQPTP